MWKDKVSAIKLKSAEIKETVNQSGVNGLKPIKELNDNEIRILSVMTSDYVDGDGETQEGGLNEATLAMNIVTEVTGSGISEPIAGHSRDTAIPAEHQETPTANI